MYASKVTEYSTPSLPADDFKAIFRGHPGGVSLITPDDGDGPVALTAKSVASISVDPPLFVFSISALSSAAAVLTKSATLVVRYLDVNDIEVAKLGATSGFGRSTQAPTWPRLATDEPVFDGVRAWVHEPRQAPPRFLWPGRSNRTLNATANLASPATDWFTKSTPGTA